jgi:hypothetical protein
VFSYLQSTQYSCFDYPCEKLSPLQNGGLKIQMQHKKIYDIKINNLSREKYVATYEHRRAY